MGLEIAEQLGWRMPDVIVYPTGGGVGLIGIHKALTELVELGWVTGRCPGWWRAVDRVRADRAGVRGRGARSRSRGRTRSTVAFGITVPKALGDFLVLEALHATGGTAIAVEDADLLADLGAGRRGWRGCSSAPRAPRP